MNVTLAPPIPWRDRVELLPKSMAYALSLDLQAVCRGSRLQVGPGGSAGPLWHLFDHTLVTSADGAPCDVPTGRVATGDGDIGDRTGVSQSWLSLRLVVDLGARVENRVPSASTLEPASITVQCSGVINFAGGLAAFRSPYTKTLHGSVFIASYHQSSVAAYRWLERRQLFGVGRLAGSRGGDGHADWDLSFQFDLYTAA